MLNKKTCNLVVYVLLMALGLKMLNL